MRSPGLTGQDKQGFGRGKPRPYRERVFDACTCAMHFPSTNEHLWHRPRFRGRMARGGVFRSSLLLDPLRGPDECRWFYPGVHGLPRCIGPISGVEWHKAACSVPVCYWTPSGPGTGSCLYPGVRRRGGACPCPQFRRPQELPLHMQSPPPLSTRQLLPYKMYRRVRT